MSKTSSTKFRIANARRAYEGALIDWSDCPHEGNRAALQKAKADLEALGVTPE
jgi:hypothetical protein